MNYQQLDSICKNVIELTHSVGQFIQEERRKFTLSDIQKKGFNDLVTYVDKGSEQRIVEGLLKILPASGIIAEEGGESEKKEYTWIIDPLDGTTNFIHKVPCYAISIALVKDGEPIIGVVNELNLKECYSATKGNGAFMNGEKIKVSAVKELDNSLIATGFPYNEFDNHDSYMNLFKELMTCTQGLRRIGSASVDLCYVANGRFEAFYESGLKAWDVAAGCLIVQEAGGKITDYAGGSNYIFGKSIVASNSLIHTQFMDRVKKYF